MGYFFILVLFLFSMLTSCETEEKNKQQSNLDYETFELKLEKFGQLPAMDLVVSLYPKTDTNKMVSSLAGHIYKANAACAKAASGNSIAAEPVSLSFFVMKKQIKVDDGSTDVKGFYGCLSKQLSGKRIDGLEDIKYHLRLALRPAITKPLEAK